jgi:hypothetical protein
LRIAAQQQDYGAGDGMGWTVELDKAFSAISPPPQSLVVPIVHQHLHCWLPSSLLRNLNKRETEMKDVSTFLGNLVRGEHKRINHSFS